MSPFISNASGAAPFRLFEIGVTRFVREDSGETRVENGRLDALGRLLDVTSSRSFFPANIPEAAIGKTLIHSEAWFAFGSLGREARANFQLRNDGAAFTIGTLLYYEVAPNPEARLDVGTVVNLSTRGHVAAGAAPSLIGGFVVTDQARRVLIRAVGPSLAAFGVLGALADPYLTLSKGNMPIYFNDNWSERPDAAEIEHAATAVGAFPLLRTSKDAALLIELPAGTYTAGVASESGTGTGTALLEIYVLP